MAGGNLINFTHELAGADTPDAVVALANRYIAELAPDIESFPPRCQPQGVDGADAIHHWRRQLLAEVCTLPATPDLRLQELAVFFLRASTRVHALEARAESSARARAPSESPIA